MNKGDVAFATAVLTTAVLFVLRAAEVIHLGWIWVFFLFWGPALAVVVLGVVWGVVIRVSDLIDDRQRRARSRR